MGGWHSLDERGCLEMMVTYEAINMLFQSFIAFATTVTAVVAIIVLFTNQKK